jgi:hypothetical protein
MALAEAEALRARAEGFAAAATAAADAMTGVLRGTSSDEPAEISVADGEQLVADLNAIKGRLAADEEFEAAGDVKRQVGVVEAALATYGEVRSAFEKAFSDPETVDPAKLSKEKCEAMLVELNRMKVSHIGARFGSEPRGEVCVLLCCDDSDGFFWKTQ